MSDGTPIFLSSAAGNIISSVGVTVLGACRPSSVVGAYGAILKVPQMANLMFTPVSQALYPRVNEERMKSRSAAERLVVKVGVPVCAAFLGGMVLMVIFRVPLVELLFGIEYVSESDTLIPLAVWVLFGIVDNFLGIQLLIPFGYQRLYSLLMVADCVFSVILTIAMGPAWGAMGVAWAIALSEAALTAALALALFAVTRDERGTGKHYRKDVSK